MISTRTGKATRKADPAAADSGRARIHGERPGYRGGQLLLVGDQRISISGPHANIFPRAPELGDEGFDLAYESGLPGPMRNNLRPNRT
jgi:hypothetical protein